MLGNIYNAYVSLNTIDIGLVQLSMHLTYEILGAKDIDFMIRAIEELYNTYIEQIQDGQYIINDMK